MTTPQNPDSVDQGQYYPKGVVVTTNLAINQGDAVYWDATNSTATPVTNKSQLTANLFMGVSEDTTPINVYGVENLASIRIRRYGAVHFYTTAGETYNHFDKVTIGADAQTIVKSGATGTNEIGFVIIDPPATPRPNQATPVPETILGAAGVRVRVWLLPTHPAVGL